MPSLTDICKGIGVTLVATTSGAGIGYTFGREFKDNGIQGVDRYWKPDCLTPPEAVPTYALFLAIRAQYKECPLGLAQTKRINEETGELEDFTYPLVECDKSNLTDARSKPDLYNQLSHFDAQNDERKAVEKNSKEMVENSRKHGWFGATIGGGVSFVFSTIAMMARACCGESAKNRKERDEAEDDPNSLNSVGTSPVHSSKSPIAQSKAPYGRVVDEMKTTHHNRNSR